MASPVRHGFAASESSAKGVCGSSGKLAGLEPFEQIE
jgi:hypothetical protein